MPNRSQEHLVREGRETSNGENVVVVTGPGITGTAQVGQTLTAVDPVVRGSHDTELAYQWFRGREAIAGADENTYLQVEDDEGEYITLRVVASSATGGVSTSYSRPTAVVTPA